MPAPSYTPTTWVNNTAPAISADNLNHIEQGIAANAAAFSGYAPVGGSPNYAPRAFVPADSLHTWGHSYVSGVIGGGGAYPQTLAPVLAELLGLPLRNDAWGGSSLYYNDTPVVLLQQVTRPDRFTGPGGCHAVMWGINDLNALGNSTTQMAPFQACLRAIVSRLRQAAIFEDSDPSVTYQGTWGTLNVNTYNSGSSVHYSLTTGTGFTIAVPAEFPGGTIAVGTLSWNDGSGATISCTVGSNTYSINTTATSRTDTEVHSVLRIPNLSAGAQTLTFTVTAATGDGAFLDYWAWEAPAGGDGDPIIALVKQPKPLDYTAFGSVAPGPPTDAGVNALNGIIDTVAAEFGGRCVSVSTSGIDHDATCFVVGNVHPNAKGHRYIAEQVEATLTATGLGVRWQPAPPWTAPRVEYGTAVPSQAAARTFQVGDRVINTAPTANGIAEWVCVAGGAPGTWATVPTIVGTGQVALSAGSVVVSNSAISGTSVIRLDMVTPGGTVGAHYVSAKTAGTSFTIASTSSTDTSTVQYTILAY